MKFYRIKQFFWSITAKMSIEELNYVKDYLTNYQYELFLRLSTQEQKHSFKVAKDVQNECRKLNIDKEELIKVALLHDIGKIYRRLNVIDKSILVLGDKITRGKIRSINNINKVEVYFNHGSIGFELLKDSGISERSLYLIKNHHNDFINDDDLKILMKCDSKN